MGIQFSPMLSTKEALGRNVSVDAFQSKQRLGRDLSERKPKQCQEDRGWIVSRESQPYYGNGHSKPLARLSSGRSPR